MKSNEFILATENGNKLCKAVAVLFDNPTSRTFIVYADENNSTVLKVGEVVSQDDDVIVEQLTDKEEIMQVWNEFIKLCEKQA